ETRDEPLPSTRDPHLDKVCVRFQAALRAEAQPRIEDYLASVAEGERAVLLRRLLVLEFAYHSQRGTTLILDAYHERFPEQRELINAAFREATAAGCQEGKADSVRLAAADTFPNRVQERTPGDPLHLGRFQIGGRLGAGGFGIVYKAYDPDLRRDVAVKVARLDRLTRTEDAEAYLAEARMLAQLD